MPIAAVIKHPKVVISCAYVAFDETSLNPWLSNNRWRQAWNFSAAPTVSQGQLLRGYWHFANYSSAVNSYGQNSGQAFDLDVTAHYSYENLAGGGAGGYWEDGSPVLESDSSKLITGYPSGLYSWGDPNEYRM